MNNDKLTTGELVTKKIIPPTVVVDCSQWVDTTQGTWKSGEFVTRKMTPPTVVVDCSTWDGTPTVPHLKIRVSFGSTPTPESLQTVTAELIHTLQTAAPELNLVFDPNRSVGQNGTTTLLFIPQTPTDNVESRLNDLVKQLEAAPKRTDILGFEAIVV